MRRIHCKWISEPTAPLKWRDVVAASGEIADHQLSLQDTAVVSHRGGKASRMTSKARLSIEAAELIRDLSALGPGIRFEAYLGLRCYGSAACFTVAGSG